MPSNVFIPLSAPAIRQSEPRAAVCAAAERRQFKLISPDFTVWMPITAAMLLVIGFGIAAGPLVMHDLPLLLG
jgi:hypothetical protein